jgi:transposase
MLYIRFLAIFGILVIKTIMEGNVEEIYATYKQRMAIEQCFDTLKNTLNQDRSYMHSDTEFEAWCFINHISLILGYRIFNTLKRNNLLKTNSLKDVIAILSKIRKSKINGIWRTHETTKKVMELVKKLNLNI